MPVSKLKAIPQAEQLLDLYANIDNHLQKLGVKTKLALTVRLIL
jgi:hypothetical protein